MLNDTYGPMRGARARSQQPSTPFTGVTPPPSSGQPQTPPQPVPAQNQAVLRATQPGYQRQPYAGSGGTAGPPPLSPVSTPGIQAPADPGSVVDPQGQPVVPSFTPPTAPGQYLGNRYNNEKVRAPWEEMSERYKIGLILSQFDPNQGLTPEVINALNAAGILSSGSFSGSGQNLTAPGVDRFGSGGTDDIIHNYQGGGSGNAQWAAWTSPEGQAKQRAHNAALRGSAPQGMGSLSPFDFTQGALLPGGGGGASPISQQIMALLAQQLGLSNALGGR
jgi:hypothetical protein